MTARALVRSSVAAVVVVVAGCTVTRNDPGPGPGATASAAMCNTVDMARQDVLEPRSITFTELVREDAKTDLNAYAASLMQLAPRGGDLGPYAPAIDYLIQRNLAWTEEFRVGNDDPRSVPRDEEVPMPTRTAAVDRSAERLDKDLAEGMCPAG